MVLLKTIEVLPGIIPDGLGYYHMLFCLYNISKNFPVSSEPSASVNRCQFHLRLKSSVQLQGGMLLV